MQYYRYDNVNVIETRKLIMRSNNWWFFIVLLAISVSAPLLHSVGTKRSYAEVERYMRKYYIPGWENNDNVELH